MNCALRSVAAIAVALGSLAAAHPVSATQINESAAPLSQSVSSQTEVSSIAAQSSSNKAVTVAPAAPASVSSPAVTPLQAQLPVLPPIPAQQPISEPQPVSSQPVSSPEAQPLPTIGVTPTPQLSPQPLLPQPSAPPLPSSSGAPTPTLTPAQPGLSYRVIVPASTAEMQQRVRSIVPEAFRTTVNGQTVMQAGLFRDQSTADELQRSLSRQNLQASVIRVAETVTPPPSSSRLVYRVIVPASTAEMQQRVRSIVPEAFRTTVNGQTVMQVGLFRDQSTADELQRSLSRQNLQASVLPISDTAIAPQTPSERPIVMIDPGHGGNDPGAIGIGGLREKDVTLSISQQVARVLEREGVQAILTRSVDRELELATRVQLAERADANLFVSIHANALSMSRPDVNGVETYYYNTGRSLAQSIHNSVMQTVDMSDRGVRQARFYVLRNTSMPSALVEVGFVTGRNDAAQLRNPDFLTRMASGIARGILQQVRSQ